MAAYRQLAERRWGPGWSDLVLPHEIVREWIDYWYASMPEPDHDPEDDEDDTEPGGDQP